MAIDIVGSYTKEIKTYLKKNIKSEEVLSLVSEIPEIPKYDEINKRGLVNNVLSIFSFYDEDEKYIKKSLAKIQIIRGKISSIEFLLKFKY